jgi:putative phage-type endonuclease
MIDASRFLASKGMSEEHWLEVRRGGVTATQVARAATPAGFASEVASWVNPEPVEDNAYMAFGRDSEYSIGLWLKDRFGVVPTDWVVCHAENPKFLASPDGLSVDHRLIAEIKTTGKPWGDYKSAPIAYRRQIQWQLFVTRAEACVFAWMFRKEIDGEFVAGWFEPQVVEVERDEAMIDDLQNTANALLIEMKARGL